MRLTRPCPDSERTDVVDAIGEGRIDRRRRAEVNPFACASTIGRPPGDADADIVVDGAADLLEGPVGTAISVGTDDAPCFLFYIYNFCQVRICFSVSFLLFLLVVEAL